MYKDRLPEEWDSAPLRKLVDPNRRITYGIVQPGEWQEPGKGVPLIRGQDYSSGEVAVENLRYVHENIASKYTRSTVKAGDILLSIVGYVGLCAIVPKSAEGANITQTTARVSPSSNIHGGYLAHYFRSLGFKEEIKKYTKGSAQPGLNLDDVEKMVVRKPQSLGEQITIARILDTLDTQIEQTEALIVKLEKVKEGLLHDLLTRGIDENGQLRPSPDQAPELYKESPLGLIPREWSASTIGQRLSQNSGFIQTGPFGSQLHAEEYVSEGIPVVMPQDMREIEVSKENIAQITDARANDLHRHRVIKGDLLFSRRGDLSRCSYISEHNKGWICGTGCLLLRPPHDINGYWLANIYKQTRIQAQVYGMAVGSTMVNLNSGILANIITPFPSLREQKQIAKKIMSSKRKIIEEKNTLIKLRLKKAGLMDDLLCGRVHVTPLLEQLYEATSA